MGRKEIWECPGFQAIAEAWAPGERGKKVPGRITAGPDPPVHGVGAEALAFLGASSAGFGEELRRLRVAGLGWPGGISAGPPPGHLLRLEIPLHFPEPISSPASAPEPHWSARPKAAVQSHRLGSPARVPSPAPRGQGKGPLCPRLMLRSVSFGTGGGF